MREGPWTVTSDRPSGKDIDAHVYYSAPGPSAPHGAAAMPAPGKGPILYEGFDANRAALRSMSDAVFALGAAAFLLDDPRYARRAALIVQTWFLNPKTAMEPHLDRAVAGLDANALNPGGGIMDGRPLIHAFQGMAFLTETGEWDARDQAAVRKWGGDYLKWLTLLGPTVTGGRGAGPVAVWWAAEEAATAAFVEDAAAERAVFDFYRTRLLAREVRTRGPGARGGKGTPSIPPPLELDGLATVCRIAELKGVDLWSARTAAGATLGGVADGVAEILAGAQPPKARLAGPPGNDPLDFLAFSGIGLGKPEYASLYRKLERPGNAWSAMLDLLIGRWEASGHQTRH